MKVKDHQRDSLLADLRLGGILFIILAFAWAFYLIRVPAQLAQTLAAFIAFFMLLAPIVLLANPTLIKVLNTEYTAHPARIWFIPLILWCTATLCIMATTGINLLLILVGGLYCLLPFLVTGYLQKKHPVVNWGDALVILLTLLPMQFMLLSRYGVPAVQPVFYIYPLIGIINLVIIYLVMRPLPGFSYSYRLKDNDWRTAIMNFLILFIVIFIPGIALHFFSLSADMLPFSEMLQYFLFIGFFIALPEELLFRGVLQNFIAGRVSTKKNAILYTLVPTSLISAVAHYKNAFVLDFSTVTFWPGGGHPIIVNMVIAFAAAMVFGWTLMKTRKVTAAIFVHVLFNWVWLVILNG